MVSSEDLNLIWLLAWWPGRRHVVTQSLQLMSVSPSEARDSGLRRGPEFRARDLGTPSLPGVQGRLIMGSIDPTRESEAWIKALRFPFGPDAPPTDPGHLWPLLAAARVLLDAGEMSAERFGAVHDLLWSRHMQRQLAGYPEPDDKHAEQLAYLIAALSTYLRGSGHDVSAFRTRIKQHDRHLGIPRAEEMRLGFMRGLSTETMETVLRCAGAWSPERPHLSPLIGAGHLWRRWLGSDARRFGGVAQARDILQVQPGNWVFTSHPRVFESPLDASRYLQDTEQLDKPLTPGLMLKRSLRLREAALQRWPDPEETSPRRKTTPRTGQSPERLEAHFKKSGADAGTVVRRTLAAARAAGFQVRPMTRAYEFRIKGEAVAALLSRPDGLAIVGPHTPVGQPTGWTDAHPAIRPASRRSDYNYVRWSATVQTNDPDAPTLLTQLLQFAAEQASLQREAKHQKLTPSASAPGPFPEDILPRTEGVA